ncbi:hypothetical protein G7081_02935 [Vagococcus coleopterorum]|uniref:DUF3784 domain-containing protein n=1 Tax=Vagococcus coleopterorum TaxID=2714946 RepID=A0A6G8AMD7_9ENTE|nr:hypothetical protein [Vagococcus coleopterorum]QIL46095.1 hypothetical protein G7081_02935 [Vagococcus coleopterorum]
MLSIILIISIILLLAIGFFLTRKGTTFISVLAPDDKKEMATKTILSFGKATLALSILGLICLIINQQTITLIFISLMMVISAIFSIKLAKQLS